MIFIGDFIVRLWRENSKKKILEHVLTNFFKHATIYGVVAILDRSLGLLLIPLYLSRLTPVQYGIAELTMVFSAMMAVIAPLGVQHATGRYLVYESYSKDRVIGTSYVFILISLLIFGTVLFSLSPFITVLLLDSTEYSLVFNLGVGIFMATVLGNYLAELLRIENRSIYLASLKLLMSIIKLSSICYLVLARSWKSEGILLGHLMGLSIPAVLSFGYLPFIRKFDPVLLKQYLRYGMPMVFHKLASNLLSSGDRFVLKFLLGLEAVGIYSLAYKVGNIVGNASMPVQAAYTPFVFREADSKDGPRKLMIGGSLYALYTSAIGCCVMLLAPLLVEWFSKSPRFLRAIDLVPLIVLGAFFHICYAITSFGIALREKTKYFPIITILSGLVNIILNLILIPLVGIYGAAIATVISYIIMWQMGYRINKRLYEMEYKPINVIIALSVCVMVVIALFRYNFADF